MTLPVALVMSDEVDPETIRTLRRLARSGYRPLVLVPADDGGLLAVEAGGPGLDRLLSQLGARRSRAAPAALSEREAAVLRLVADGLDTAEIAERLRYSERTIKNVIHEVISRLRLRNRSHAVAYALRAGMI